MSDLLKIERRQRRTSSFDYKGANGTSIGDDFETRGDARGGIGSERCRRRMKAESGCDRKSGDDTHCVGRNESGVGKGVKEMLKS